MFLGKSPVVDGSRAARDRPRTCGRDADAPLFCHDFAAGRSRSVQLGFESLLDTKIMITWVKHCITIWFNISHIGVLLNIWYNIA
jgi:hypothetical protein